MSFAQNANLLLLRHVMTARERGLDYAPDNGGPHTVYISRMLHNQAQAWAADMQEARDDDVRVDGRQTWMDAIASVDERVKRYLEQNGFRPKAVA